MSCRYILFIMMIIDDSYVHEENNRCIVEDLFYTKSISMLYGKDKMGKSYLALYLSGCISDGKYILNRLKVCDNNKVLYFNGEMPVNILKNRINKLMDKYNFTFNNLIVVNKFPFKSIDGIKEFIKIKIEQYKPSFVVIDSISFYFWDINIVDKIDAQKFMQFLYEMAFNYDIHILFINHQKKTDVEFIGDRLIGSLSTNVFKVEIEKGNVYKCYLEKSHIGSKLFIYYWFLKDGTIIIKENKPKWKKSKKDEILNILNDNREIRVNDLYNMIKNKMARATYYNILKKLEKDGIIKREGSTRNAVVKLIKEV